MTEGLEAIYQVVQIRSSEIRQAVKKVPR